MLLKKKKEVGEILNIYMNKSGNKEACCAAIKKKKSNIPTESEEDNVSSLTKQIVFGPAFDSAKKWYFLYSGLHLLIKNNVSYVKDVGDF